MASRYWNKQNASANWNATSPTNWGSASNTADGASIPNSADDVFFDGVGGGANNCTISANTGTIKTINFTGYTNTLTQNAGVTLTVGGNATFVSGMTYTPTDTSTLTISTGATLTTGGLLMPNVTFSAGTTLTLGDNLSFMASKLINLTISGTAVGMNGKSINGNSATNRVLIRSGTLGTAKSITSATTSFTNADFRDITFSSASSLDLSAITGLSGDCGGNSITGGGSTLTFTTPATQTATGNSANWSAATWTSRVPLPQDDVVLSLTAGQTLTNDMPRMGKSISVTTAMNLSTNTIAQTLYGSLDLTNVSTFTSGTTGTWTFEGRTTNSLTSSGKSFGGSVTFQLINGTMTFYDAFSETSGTTSFLNGTFVISDVNMSMRIFSGSNSAITVTMGNGTWTVASTGTVFSMNASATVTPNSSTILISDTGASSKTFTGGGRTYNNLTITGSGAGAVIIQNSNTFNTFTINSPKTVTFTSGTTQTVSNFVATGTAGNLVTINASTGGSAATLTAANTIPKNNDYMSITDINVTNGTFFYGGHSTYVSGTGWKQGNSSDMFRSLY